jgi:hypothetical protein
MQYVRTLYYIKNYSYIILYCVRNIYIIIYIPLYSILYTGILLLYTHAVPVQYGAIIQAFAIYR